MAKKNRKSNFQPSVVRIIFGTLVGYLVPLIALFIVVFAAAFYHGYIATVRWLDYIIIFFLLIVAIATPFYFYGWLHYSFVLYAEHANKFVRFLGYIFGGIGYVFRPIVLLIWGRNKKWLYFFLVGLPCLLGGVVFLLNYLDVLAFDAVINFSGMPISLHAYSMPITIALFLNAFLALLTRRCNLCGCMMTEIVHDINSIDYTKYDKVGDVDVYGDRVAIGKYYVCTCCGNVKKGIGFSIQTDTIVT